jgi:SAM-dependent methyltransferase
VAPAGEPVRQYSAVFYGPDQAPVHHERFGALSRDAARMLLAELAAGGHRTGTVVDLGCGSGIFARFLTDAGFDVVGVDLSADMVAIARTAAPVARFTVGSVHDFPIPEAIAVVALGEVLNYDTDGRAGLDALGRLARRVRRALAGGGCFLFDVAAPGRAGPTGTYERFLDAPSWSIGVHGREHDATLERTITIFRRDGDRYRRVDEHHVLRLYEPGAVRHALEEAGFTVEVRAGYGGPDAFPGWHVFVAR